MEFTQERCRVLEFVNYTLIKILEDLKDVGALSDQQAKLLQQAKQLAEKSTDDKRRDQSEAHPVPDQLE